MKPEQYHNAWNSFQKHSPHSSGYTNIRNQGIREDNKKMPMKIFSSLGETFSSQGEMTGIIRYKEIRGPKNHR